MRSRLRLPVLLGLVAALFLAVGCASGDSSHDGPSADGPSLDGSSTPRKVDPGDPVAGNVLVTWKNLDTRRPDVTLGLVNESSEMGRKLRSGRVSSTEIRVMSDADMGTLLDELDDVGFFEHATRGVGIATAPDVPGRRGIVVVNRDGTDLGLMLTPNLGGTPLPKVYQESKRLVFGVHSMLQGFEVRVNAPEDRVFKAPTIGLPKRR